MLLRNVDVPRLHFFSKVNPAQHYEYAGTVNVLDFCTDFAERTIMSSKLFEITDPVPFSRMEMHFIASTKCDEIADLVSFSEEFKLASFLFLQTENSQQFVLGLNE